MKNIIFCLGFLIISVSGFSQELTIDKKFDFTDILEQHKNDDFKFTATTFYTSMNKQPVLSYTSYIIFPLVEEKEQWKFGGHTQKQQYAPIINLDNFYRSIPKFVNFAPHLQGKQGEMKILKGYDFCGRAIY